MGGGDWTVSLTGPPLLENVVSLPEVDLEFSVPDELVTVYAGGDGSGGRERKPCFGVKSSREG